MEINYILQGLIKDGVAVVCSGPDDVIKLSEWVEVLCPGCGERIRAYKGIVGEKRDGGKFAIRLELFRGSLDYGWDSPSYYERRGMTVVNFSALNCDLGTFNTDDADLSLLFNT